MNELRVIPIEGIPEIDEGADVSEAIATAAGPSAFEDGDIVVVAHKAVSKSEGRVIVASDRSIPALAESARVLRRSGDTIISETSHGFVCANAGVDASNVEPGKVALLPLDPDLSARRIRTKLERATGARLGVVISDTFGRAWRLGQTNVAIGVAGFDPFVDYRGHLDSHGQGLTATCICIADEIASAAEMVMGKSTGICAAIVRGASVSFVTKSASDIVRPSVDDLFR